jgi:hypothetical protein
MLAFKIIGDGVLFGGIVIVTLPFPLPETGVAPSPDALHPHAWLEAVTPMLAVPPAEVTLRLEGLMANEQLEPNCVRLYVCPFTVILPVLGLRPLFGPMK